MASLPRTFNDLSPLPRFVHPLLAECENARIQSIKISIHARPTPRRISDRESRVRQLSVSPCRSQSKQRLAGYGAWSSLLFAVAKQRGSPVASGCPREISRLIHRTDSRRPMDNLSRVRRFRADRLGRPSHRPEYKWRRAADSHAECMRGYRRAHNPALAPPGGPVASHKWDR